MKGVYALTEDIKKEDVKEEEVAQTTEEVVEESNQPSELEEAQARADLKTNTFVLMQKCKTFSAVPMKNVNNYKNTVAKIWQKRSYHHWTTSNVPLPSKD